MLDPFSRFEEPYAYHIWLFKWEINFSGFFDFLVEFFWNPIVVSWDFYSIPLSYCIWEGHLEEQ